MNELTSIDAPVINGIDLGVVGAIAEAVTADPAAAQARFAPVAVSAANIDCSELGQNREYGVEA